MFRLLYCNSGLLDFIDGPLNSSSDCLDVARACNLLHSPIPSPDYGDAAIRPLSKPSCARPPCCIVRPAPRPRNPSTSAALTWMSASASTMLTNHPIRPRPAFTDIGRQIEIRRLAHAERKPWRLQHRHKRRFFIPFCLAIRHRVQKVGLRKMLERPAERRGERSRGLSIVVWRWGGVVEKWWSVVLCGMVGCCAIFLCGSVRHERTGVLSRKNTKVDNGSDRKRGSPEIIFPIAPPPSFLVHQASSPQ